VRPRLRRLLSALRGPRVPAAGQAQASPAEANPTHPRSDQAPPTPDDPGHREAERRLEDARRRLKRAVPPRED
jgi:hypothetical protein